MAEKKRKVGRPSLPMPEPIPDTADNIAAAMFRVPAKKRSEWRYLQDKKDKTERKSTS
jgi:hypothetical protein